MLRKMIGPNRDVVKGEWRRLHSEGFIFVLLTKCYSGDQIESVLGVTGRKYGEEAMCRRVLVGTSQGKKPRRRPICRRDDNFEMDLQGVGCRA